MLSTSGFDRRLLGGLSPEQFLKRYWQKKPFLIRGATPDFRPITTERLFQLAKADDVESRLVSHSRGAWQIEHGPFASFPRRKSNWTLLVQGVNLHDEAGDALMRRFSFIANTRLDDLMVSYAVDGGGVGPHFDNYDVFLLQVEGRRRWRISAQKDLELLDDAPLKILRDFRAQQEFVLDPGDMLYLPPQIAHEGVALGACMTYSIGFRAPGFQEVVREFLIDQAERISLSGRYRDPLRRPARLPAQLDTNFIDSMSRRINALRWTQIDVVDFIGRYMTEPKAQVYFERNESLSAARFIKRASATGLKLHPKTQMLYRGARFFINGESFKPTARTETLRRLANTRCLSASDCAELARELQTLNLLLEWYAAGWLTQLAAPITK